MKIKKGQTYKFGTLGTLLKITKANDFCVSWKWSNGNDMAQSTNSFVLGVNDGLYKLVL